MGGTWPEAFSLTATLKPAVVAGGAPTVVADGARRAAAAGGTLCVEKGERTVGILAKAATRKRVQPLKGPLNGVLTRSRPWLTNGSIPAGGLIRSAVLAHSTDSMASAVGRGRQSALLAPHGNTHLWVETGDFLKWNVIAGVPMMDDSIAVDWSVDLDLDTTAGTASVATTRWLTTDGALAHGEFHDSLRNELLRALALGREAEGSDESEVSAVSTSVPQPFEQAPPAPFEAAFSFTTALDEAAARDRLTHLGHRVLDPSGPGLRWGIGLPARQDASQVSEVVLTFATGRLDARARVASESPTERRIAAQALHNLVLRAYRLLRGEDPSVRYHGPEEWKP